MCFVQTLAALTEADLYLKMNIRKNTEDTNKRVKKNNKGLLPPDDYFRVMETDRR